MTNVKVVKQNGSITEVTCDGHTGYGVEGEDIVCASLSSIVQTAMLGVLSVAGVNMQFDRRDEEGYLRFVIPENITPAQRKICDNILDTMLLGVADLYQGFSDFIELEVE
ncbi:MAG: ribosomal-processing cysteine protease Prp [Clostridia bacterium]|nr:ribosomal-processing cysteine protease Prp [Clostridia bacterium]